MAKLFITLADSGQMTHQLAGAVITIGRYPDNMIQINHASVSGHHARLISRNGRYHLQDLNSTPRSYLNGMPSSEADLPDSCVLRFGTVECVFKDEVSVSPIDQYVTRLAESQRQVDTIIRARDALHQQVQALQKHKEEAEMDREEHVYEIEELRRQLAAVQGQQPDSAPKPDPEPALRLAKTEPGARQDLALEFEKRLEEERLAAGQLGAQLSEARAEIERLVGEIHETRKGRSDVSTGMQALVQERDAMSAKLAESIQQMEAATRERDTVQQWTEELSKALGQAKQQIAAVAGERDTLKKESVERRKQEKILADLDASRQREFDDLSRQLAQALEQNKALLQDRDAAAQGQDGLSGALGEARTQFETISAEHDALRTQHEESVALIEDQRGKIASMEEERGEWHRHVEELSRQLAEALEQNKVLVQDRDAEAQGHEGLAGALNEARRQCETISGEHEALRAQHEEGGALIEEQRGRIAAMEEERGEWHRHVEEVTRQLAEARQELEHIGGVRDASEQTSRQQALQFDELRGEIEAERGMRHELAETLEQQRLEISALAEQREHERTKADALGKELEELASQRGDLAGQLEKSRREITSLAGERETLRQQNEEFAASLAEARDKMESISKMRGSNRQEIEAIRLDRDSLKQQQAEWVVRLEQMQKQLAPVIEERNRTRAEIDRAAASLAETEDRIKAVTRERDAALAAARELIETRRQLEAAGTERDSLRDRCNELDAKLKDHKQPPDAEKAFQQFNTVVARKEEEIARLKQELNARTRKPSAADAPLSLASPIPHVERIEENERPPLGHEKPPQAFEKPPPQFEKVERPPAPVIGTGTRSVPSLLSATRNRLHYFIRHPGDQTIMGELSQHVHEIRELTGQSNMDTSHKLASVVDGMVDDLCNRPDQVTPALLRTLSQSVDFLITLQEPRIASRAKNLQKGNIFVVDDDPGILDAIVPALEEACLNVSCAEQAKKGLKILAEQKFELVLLDVGLPEMNGMDLCAKIRGIPHHKKTPILFLTGMDTVQNRVQSMLSGGNDFIGKPFNTWELAAKSLIWVLKGQLSII